MNKVLYTFIALLTLTSCASSFDIQGTSNISTLDGRKLYLKVLANNEFKNSFNVFIKSGMVISD